MDGCNVVWYLRNGCNPGQRAGQAAQTCCSLFSLLPILRYFFSFLMGILPIFNNYSVGKNFHSMRMCHMGEKFLLKINGHKNFKFGNI